MSGDPVQSLQALHRRAPWAERVLDWCPECNHRSHAGRCFGIVQEGPRVAYCPCKHKREDSDVPDQPATSGQPVLPVAGLPAAQDMARDQLASIGRDLVEISTDILERIDAIRATMRGERG